MGGIGEAIKIIVMADFTRLEILGMQRMISQIAMRIPLIIKTFFIAVQKEKSE
jgi:hypothetical protein